MLIDFDADFRFVRAEFQSAVTPSQFLESLTEIFQDPRYSPQISLLCLVDGARLDKWSSDDVRFVSSRAGMLDGIGPERLASVASSDAAYGMARMWQAYADGQSRRERMVFRNEQEALAWISGEGDEKSGG